MGIKEKEKKKPTIWLELSKIVPVNICSPLHPSKRLSDQLTSPHQEQSSMPLSLSSMHVITQKKSTLLES